MRVVVAGLGVSGAAAAQVLRERGHEVVTVDDANPAADVSDGAAWAQGAFRDLSAPVDLLVVSPGWTPDHPVLVAARDAGVEVVSEVELAWRLRVPGPSGEPAPWLVVTGTNGKTTTVGMLESILVADGRRTAAVGNVGAPVVLAATDPTLDVLAVELSSFQLHHTSTMSAQAAAVLNLAPDHLDWHGSMDAYVRDKGRVYDRVARACVYNEQDRATERLVTEADVLDGARAIGFTRGAPLPGQVGVVDDLLVDRAFHAEMTEPGRRDRADELATLADLAHLAGADGRVPAHVVANALAAAALARAHGVAAGSVAAGLRAYQGGAHRIARVATLDGVDYVDDSKATNAHAASASLGSFEQGTVVWVAGGLAKGATFDDLVRARRDRLRAVVLIGTDVTDLARALERHASEVPVVRVDPGETETVMTRAVRAARDHALPGDTVLLAPACASMDQFRSYAARGEAFTDAVVSLGGGDLPR